MELPKFRLTCHETPGKIRSSSATASSQTRFEIERGRDAIQEFFQLSNFPELAEKSSELAFLEEWLEEVSSKRPLSKLEIMQREMEVAIASELYERAAELRDAIKLLQTQSS